MKKTQVWIREILNIDVEKCDVCDRPTKYFIERSIDPNYNETRKFFVCGIHARKYSFDKYEKDSIEVVGTSY
tara:strand:+ start:53 stop:268 length:216 start_codon:yes stop_codon:yes gene_type:complete